MQEEVSTAAAQSALENYGSLVIEIMKQRRVCTTQLALRVGVDRSHLCKVRRGDRPITARLLDDLIRAMELDRARMALAVGVLGQRELYTDPAFGNVCTFAGAILHALLDLLQAPGRFDRSSVFAALSPKSCEVLAEHSIRHVLAQFAKLETALDTQDDEDRSRA